MSRWEAWTLHVGTTLVGGTGVIYAWMIYFATPSDPFAVVNSPWQPLVQHLHVLFAPLLVFGAGIIWKRHALFKLRLDDTTRRRSGLSLLWTLAPMIVSGYLLQIAVDETWRQVWVWVHVSASALWIVGYVGHQLSKRGHEGA